MPSHFSAGGCLLTHPVLVCLQTCQTTAVPGAVEEAGAFRSRQHQTHHTELAEKGQDAHQGTKITNKKTPQLYEKIRSCLQHVFLNSFDKSEPLFISCLTDN